MHRPDDITATLVDEGPELEVGGSLCLIVTSKDFQLAYPLPESGTVSIGRGGCDYVVGESSVSRHHANLYLGHQLFIEDKSTNGTRVRGSRLPAGARIPIAVGDMIELGLSQVWISVQTRSTPMIARATRPHAIVRARLAAACARGNDRDTLGNRGKFGNHDFCLVRLQCDYLAAAVIEETLVATLDATDVAGLYAPHDYEVLLLGAGLVEATARVAHITQRLSALGGTVRSGIACHPHDGRDPEALIERASAAVRGEEQADVDGTVMPGPGAMSELYEEMETLATGSSLSLLLLGETGVGKKVIAHRFHQRSPRSTRPFITLNVASIAENLLESELFGHEKGAFTGAVAAKPGLFECADGGTVFLDEIGELPTSLQAKLLNVLEDNEVRRVGGTKMIPIDVRFISATNRDLKAEISAGRFRRDLFYRLNGATLKIPPLRQRVGEIEGLARVFVAAACRKLATPKLVPAISREAMEALQAHRWPGNIRELKNVIGRAVCLCKDGIITLSSLQLGSDDSDGEVPTTSNPPQMLAAMDHAGAHAPLVSNTPRSLTPVRLPSTTVPPSTNATQIERVLPSNTAEVRQIGKDAERILIVNALEQCGWNQSRAARLIGMSRRTFISRLVAYQITRPRHLPADKPPR